MIFIVGRGLEMGVIVAQDMERNERESLVFFFFSVSLLL